MTIRGVPNANKKGKGVHLVWETRMGFFRRSRMGVFMLDLSRVVTASGGITASSFVRCVYKRRTIILWSPFRTNAFHVLPGSRQILSVGTTRWNRYTSSSDLSLMFGTGAALHVCHGGLENNPLHTHGKDIQEL